MNPIVLAAFHGLAAGLLAGPETDSKGRRLKRRPKRAYANFGAPVVEETIYRALPMAALGAGLPFGATAAWFAADHVVAERAEHTAGSAAIRFGDVLLGGLLYESAFRRFGFLGAVGAHALHNIMAGVGRGIR